MADCPDNDKTLSAAFPEKAGSLIVGDINEAVAGAAASYDIVNKMAVATQNYNAFNSVVNQLLGYDVRWFRAVPQQRSKDVIFQEYTLSNVEETPLCMKVVIPDGRFPDSKYNFDLMGLEYEVPLEVQIDKLYWESIAGFGTAPQKKDIIYFPLPNKLYEVESSHLFRGFMEQETAWKINLMKYQPLASRRESVQLQDTIDQYTVSVDEIFGEAINSDVKKLVDDQQMNQYNSTSVDKYKTTDASLVTISTPFQVYGTIVAQSFYDLQTSNSIDAVSYKLTDNIGLVSDRSLVAWTMLKDIPTIHKECIVNSITLAVYPYIDPSTQEIGNYTIQMASPNPYSVGETIIIYREGAINFYAIILSVDDTTNPTTYHCNIDDSVISHLNEITTSWSSLPGYKGKVKEPINIIDGLDTMGDHKFTVNIYANQFIKINYGTQEYVAILSDKLLDTKWYGIAVNIGNQWGQYNVYVWERHDTDENAKLQIFFYETINLIPEEIAISNFTINKSPGYLTNLRLFNTTVEEERQSNELLSYFSKDGDQIIIADLAETKLRLPYITKQR